MRILGSLIPTSWLEALNEKADEPTVLDFWAKLAPVDEREIMNVRTNRAGVALTTRPTAQEDES